MKIEGESINEIALSIIKQIKEIAPLHEGVIKSEVYKKLAVLFAEGASEALRQYGDCTDELQNMDEDFRFYDKLVIEILKLDRCIIDKI
jgi:hypothetical protein